MVEARGFWIMGPGKSEIRPTPSMPADDGQVTVRTLYSGVSAGTERLVFQGRVPPSQYAVMRAPFQVGVFPGPLLYGYSNVGAIVAGPENWIGQKVFSLYPHVECFTLPPDAVTVIPGNVPPTRAILAANMETALNAIWDARPLFSEQTAVIGAGVVGCLVAKLASRSIGSAVTLIDIDPEKATIANSLGLRFARPKEVGEEFDLIIHASGNPAGLQQALAIAAFEARIIELSWYGDQPVELQLGANFHSRRLTIQSSQVGHVARSMRHRLDHRERLALALNELTDPVFDHLIDHDIGFAELPNHFEALAAHKVRAMCTRVNYDSEKNHHV